MYSPLGTKKATEKMVKTHGCSGKNRNQIYRSWTGMRHMHFKKYIYMCDEWRDNFLAFREWAILCGNIKNKRLRRKDKTEGYSPNNCYWITSKIGYKSITDKRKNKIIHLYTNTNSKMYEIEKKLNVDKSTIYQCLRDAGIQPTWKRKSGVTKK